MVSSSAVEAHSLPQAGIAEDLHGCLRPAPCVSMRACMSMRVCPLCVHEGLRVHEGLPPM